MRSCTSPSFHSPLNLDFSDQKIETIRSAPPQPQQQFLTRRHRHRTAEGQRYNPHAAASPAATKARGAAGPPVAAALPSAWGWSGRCSAWRRRRRAAPPGPRPASCRRRPRFPRRALDGCRLSPSTSEAAAAGRLGGYRCSARRPPRCSRTGRRLLSWPETRPFRSAPSSVSPPWPPPASANGSAQPPPPRASASASASALACPAPPSPCGAIGNGRRRRGAGRCLPGNGGFEPQDP